MQSVVNTKLFLFCSLIGFFSLSLNQLNAQCAIPSGLLVSDIDGTSATISWNAVPGVDNYEVEVEDDENTPLFHFNEITLATNVQVNGLNPNGNYKVKVKSKCSGGNNSDWSEWVFFSTGSGNGGGGGTDPVLCTVPVGLTLIEVNAGNATFSWNSVAGATGYELEVEDGDNTPPFTFNMITTDTFLTVGGILADGQYKAKVQAKCAGGSESDYSAWLFFSVQSNTGGNDDCSTPNGLFVASITPTTATIQWNAAASQLFKVKVKATGTTPAFNYSVITAGNSVDLTGLAPAGTYKIKVKAKCADGTLSNFSNPLAFTTSSGSTGNGVCAIPTGLMVSDISNTSALISWNAVPGVDGYEVEVEDGDNTPLFNFNEITTATNILIEGLSLNGQYKVKVKSRCSGGNNSDYTEWLFFFANPNSNPGSGTCTVPTGLLVTSITNNSAIISWDALNGVAGYEVEVEDDENTPAFNFNVITSSNSVEVTGLAPNGQYQVKVKSKCGGNDSDYSDWVFFQTPGLNGNLTTFELNGLPTTDFAISPNPATDLIQINFDALLEGTPLVVNIIGMDGRVHRRVQEAAFTGTTLQMQTHDLPAGFYLLTIQQGADLLPAQRLVITQ